jgi:hypothetical protein
MLIRMQIKVHLVVMECVLCIGILLSYFKCLKYTALNSMQPKVKIRD